MFEIAETAAFRKAVSALPKRERELIENKLKTYTYPILRLNPYNGPNIKRLAHYNPTTWRYRIGAYRIFYEIRGTVVFLTAVQRRKDAYR